MYNIFFSADGASYSSVFLGGQQVPTDLDFLHTGLTSYYKHFAIAATGYGSLQGYVEALNYTSMPVDVAEPATLALLGLGLAGLGFSRRRNKA